MLARERNIGRSKPPFWQLGANVLKTVVKTSNESK
jgi:hypothetical protein